MQEVEYMILEVEDELDQTDLNKHGSNGWILSVKEHKSFYLDGVGRVHGYHYTFWRNKE